ncbi:MAG: site-specific DNA-methyltransferase [Methylococcales bacterium]|nr:site-specific DNA-methyltransferase [Methylococcales bacterium]
MPELHFKGKEYVYNHHLNVPFRPLLAQPDKSIGEDSGNLIIHGDNLHALKALLPRYAGKVDCIFIDPPYNTGNENLCYNDNVNSPIMREWLNSNPVNREDMLRHDKWLAMMWPRLKLLYELLDEDGLLFISIDDNEASRLQIIVEEIFGDDSLLGRFIWKSRQNKDNRNINGLSNDHEYILIVGKLIAGETRANDSYSNPDADPRGPWASGNMVGLASQEDRPNLHYDLIDPNTNTNYGCPARGWRYEKSTMDRLISENCILWPVLVTGRPREKTFLAEMSEHTNISSIINFPIFTRDGTDSFERIMGTREFAFPKPPELIEFLIRQHPKNDALILDSFAGSATTAHSVLAQNAKDGGIRKFILVECEDYADTLTAERVRRVINGYEFQGTQKEELYREKITWTNFSKEGPHHKLLQHVQSIENLDGLCFETIKKEIKDGELIVTGENKITKRVAGLGGGFTFYTLGEPLEIDKILTGETLPDYQTLGAWLFHTATGQPLKVEQTDAGCWYLGASDSYHVWLIYRPDLDFLKSREAALTLSLAEQIGNAYKDKPHLVFAPAKYVPNKMLLPLGVEHAPLPFALYRMEKD